MFALTVNLRRPDLAWSKLIDGQTRRQLVAVAAREFVAMSQEVMGANKPNRPAPWPPLSPRYAKRVKPPIPTLLRSGKLRSSFSWMPMGNDFAEVRVDADYAAYHQTGTSRMPARPFLPLKPGTTELTTYAHARIDAAIIRRLSEINFG